MNFFLQAISGHFHSLNTHSCDVSNFLQIQVEFDVGEVTKVIRGEFWMGELKFFEEMRVYLREDSPEAVPLAIS